MQPLPQTTLAIREMQFEDIPAVSELAVRIWREHYRDIISCEQIEYMLPLGCSTESITKKYITEKSQRFWLVYDEGALAGYIALEQKASREWYIDKLYVDVARHRKGLGSALLAHIERIVKPKALTLRVNRANIKAINFYMRHGFFITALDVLDIGNGFVMDDFLMRWNA